MKENFKISKEDKLDIAEFLHAVHTDTLIRSELIKCIDAFKNAGVVSNREHEHVMQNMHTNDDEVMRLMGDYLVRISDEQGQSIMRDYYSGKL